MSTSTINREIFVAPEGEEQGLPALNTEALYALGLWVQEDQRATEKVTDWMNRAWRQDVWAEDYDKEDMPTAGEWEGALDTLAPACGASFCLAGNTVASSPNHRILWSNHGAHSSVRIEATGEYDMRGVPIFRDVPGSKSDIATEAGQILGLTMREMNHLFEEGNEADYILARINGCCEARVLPILFSDAGSTTESRFDWAAEKDDLVL